jgi:transcriptional regulator with XRE-family HTH domain
VTPSAEAAGLAGRLRELRSSRGLTQSVLAKALSGEGRVAVATVSSWESLTSPKLPPAERLRSYALFFARTDAADPAPRLPRERDLTPDERDRFHSLHQELLGLRDAVRGVDDSVASGGSLWTFDSGPVTIICPEVPEDRQSPLAKEVNPNYTQAHRYADLDALIDLWGHIRARNPQLDDVTHELSAEIDPDLLNGHLVVLGGIAWNQVADGVQKKLEDLPIHQVAVEDLENGEIFRSREPDGREYRPEWSDADDAVRDGHREHQNFELEAADSDRIAAEQTQDAWRDGKRRRLSADVALLARLRNPYTNRGTLTICSGVYSRGVLGAVRALTDPKVRERNEAYIANRFPSGWFAMLMRVPVVNSKPVAPDLEVADNRLFEWSPDEKADG